MLMSYICNNKWLMSPPAFHMLNDIVSKVNNSPEAIAKAFHGTNYERFVTEDAETPVKHAFLPSITASNLEGTHSARFQKNTAIIPVIGMIYPRSASVPMSYGSNVQLTKFSHDLKAVMEMPSVDRVILVFDTPGGDATGVAEAADLIYQYRDTKEIIAYVYGSAASAGLFLAMACSRVYAANTAELGSLGVMTMYVDRRAQQEANGIKTVMVMSDLSPNKNLDPGTEKGLIALKDSLNELAKVFVSSVGKYKGMSFNEVMDKFGQGSMFSAQQAIEVGMLDEITTFDTLLNGSENNVSQNKLINKENTMKTAAQIKQEHPAAHAEIMQEGAASAAQASEAQLVAAKAEGVGAENKRVASLLSFQTVANVQLSKETLLDPTMDVEKVTSKLAESTDKQLTEQRQLFTEGQQDLATKLEGVGNNTTNDEPQADSKEAAQQAFDKMLLENVNK